MSSQLLFDNLNQPAILSQGWQICSTPPGAVTGIEQLNDSLPWLNAAYPGTAAAILQDLGLWSIDEDQLRFDALDWWYRCSFDLPADANIDTVLLGFEGLASIAEVWLNGRALLKSLNMFHAHLLQPGENIQTNDNNLVLVFRSLDQQLQQRYPRPRWRAPMMENQQLRQIRTSILGRTPGWTPPCPAVGPWRPVWLNAKPQLAIDKLHLHTKLSDDATGMISLSFKLKNFGLLLNDIATVELCVSKDHHSYTARLTYDHTQQNFTADLQIDSVQAWWPHTHGEPCLYAAKIHVTDSHDNSLAKFDLGNIGFRNITVNQLQGDFKIAINGVDIFCRGACWMPLNPVSLGSSHADYLQALTQFKLSGMNMLRVTGASTYEADCFYQLCDQQGIMVWQDFMFAGMDYPENPEFIESVIMEARQQLSRWQCHPAITIICGNSEVEQQAAMWGASRSLWNPNLFYQTLADLSKEYYPEAFYWPSANHGGGFPHQCDEGTVFYYGFSAYLRPLEDVRLSRVRFATECLAFANIPETSTLKLMPGGQKRIPKVHHPVWKMRSPRDLGGAGWDFDDIRDYYLAYYFKLDPMQLRYYDHERYILLSKITCGEMMAQAYNEWRSKFSACNGALIWFLRDLWPGAGWGIIDSQGLPKSCYYYLKRVLQPISISLSDEGGNGYYLHINNEHASSANVIAEINVYKNAHILVANSSRTMEISPRQQSAEPLSLWFEGFLDLNFSYRFGPAMADSIHACLKSQEGTILAETFAFPTGPASIPNDKLGLSAKASLLPDGNAEVQISTEKLAIAVHFDVEGFIPEDNYFNLAPKQNKTVLLRNTQSKPKSLYASLNAINATDSVSLSVSLS